MAFSPGGQDGPVSEINVTALVDVMLVLLIIFMVTAPLLTQGVEVNLPKTSADPLPTQAEPLVISVTAQGTPAIETRNITMDEMVIKVRAIRQQNPTIQIYVRGDKDAASADPTTTTTTTTTTTATTTTAGTTTGTTTGTTMGTTTGTTMSARSMVGTTSSNTVPSEPVEATRTLPPTRATCLATTSSPTPRPDTVETSSLVVTP